MKEVVQSIKNHKFGKLLSMDELYESYQLKTSKDRAALANDPNFVKDLRRVMNPHGDKQHPIEELIKSGEITWPVFRNLD